MIEFWNLLKDDAAVKAVNDRIKGLSSLAPNTEALVIATAFRQQPRNLVIVKNNLYTAQQLFRKLTPLLQEDVLIFNVEESLRVEAIASTPTMYARQMETLADIVLNNKPRVIITHPTALVRYLPSVETFRRHIIELKNDQVIRMDQLKKLLIESGYRQASRVDQPLTFSMRGDVVDVFTIQENYPV
ncbi:MAG: transcription-repair coupling factor, partial [Erysipelotrichaceae bacterium]|nr:transcription-repair coupling factor [Erysipelotrichaceae bacterium]